MNEWQVGVMVENEAAAEWERQNASDPFEDKMKNAAGILKQSGRDLNQSEYEMLDAIKVLEGTPMRDKLASLLCTLEDIHTEIIVLASKYERGVRE